MPFGGRLLADPFAPSGSGLWGEVETFQPKTNKAPSKGEG